MSGTWATEGQEICEALARGMPPAWDGMECIQALKSVDYNWRQMEWIGWYNEFKAKQVVRAALGGDDGPRYGRTGFDYRRKGVWDFKAHPAGKRWTILNDREAVDTCIKEYGAAGFVVTLGEAEYNDVAGTFKLWHDELKGGTSRYERERIARGVPPRRRKVRFRVAGFEAFVLDSPTIQNGLRDRWLKMFQEGMRNANGSPRRAKYSVNVGRIPATVLIAQARF